MERYLLVGLGNPGKQYKYTRHNIGFYVIDVFAELYHVTFEKADKAYLGLLKMTDKVIYIIKPMNFVNNSGEVVMHYIDYFKIDINNILVVVDDINLDFGVIRFREKGSSGGHNGLKNIEQYIGPGYARIRYGVGHDFQYGQQNEYVLKQLTFEERKNIHATLPVVIGKIQEFLHLQTLQNI